MEEHQEEQQPAMSIGASSSEGDPLRELREAARRRLRRERVRAAISRTIRAPLADVLRDHALVHLPPAALARLRLVHPSWARAIESPLFPVAHAASPRPRCSGLFFVAHSAEGFLFLPFDGAADTVPSPSLEFVPASSELAVLSSSHGLACCFSPADDACFVCNPATARWTAVPTPPRRTWPRPAVVVLFDASPYNFRGDYTLVCAFESAPGSDAYCFTVFTSGTGAWWVAADAVAPAEGLVPASGVAAGGTAWWRTSIGTAVGFDTVTGCSELAMCPGDSTRWEIGSVAGTLHCAVLTDTDVVVFRRLDDARGHGGWEEAARVAVVDILQSWTPPEPVVHEADADAEADQEKEAPPRGVLAVANRIWLPSYDLRLLPFQGGDVEVVVLHGGRHVVAFDTATRRRRVATLPDPPAGRDWSAAEFVVHTNTLALVAPAVLSRELALTEPPDDQDEVAASA